VITVSYTRRIFGLLCLANLFLTFGCSAPVMEPESHHPGENVKQVFVVHDRWHAAIVLSKADLPAGAVPERAHFPTAEYLEISWGDQDYFPAETAGVRLALRAAFWSRGSVLHVVGIAGAIENHFPGANIIAISLSEPAFQQLSDFLSASFHRPQPGVPAQPSRGLLPQGRFYHATGKFSILRTCNTWVAEALQYAGVAINPSCVITASSLGRRLRAHAVAK